MMPVSNQEPQIPDVDRARRQRWISVFARTSPHVLEELLDEMKSDQRFQVLRAPERGLVMVRARAGGQGTLFNSGEMTVTRCSVRSTKGTVGHGYVAGRNNRHAELAAKLDAVMQDLNPAEADNILAPLDDDLTRAASARQQKSASTRVDFYTIVRGED